MEDSLSKRYLLYLRDMSRKIVYGAASSAGDYSQVLIRGYKKDNGRIRTSASLVTSFIIKHIHPNLL